MSEVWGEAIKVSSVQAQEASLNEISEELDAEIEKEFDRAEQIFARLDKLGLEGCTSAFQGAGVYIIRHTGLPPQAIRDGIRFMSDSFERVCEAFEGKS